MERIEERCFAHWFSENDMIQIDRRLLRDRAGRRRTRGEMEEKFRETYDTPLKRVDKYLEHFAQDGVWANDAIIGYVHLMLKTRIDLFFNQG